MKNNISILFGGDFVPARRYEPLALKKGSDLFGGLQRKIAKADLSFLNLESPLCINTKAIHKWGSNIRAHPGCVNLIADAGFDVVGLANNHIMDFGVEGLEETMNACRKVGLQTCGVGDNLHNALMPLFIEKCGVKIALIAVAEHEWNIAEENKPGAAPLDPIDNLTQLEHAKQLADLVFITIHGGNEYFPFPRPGLRKICKFYIRKGADAVICHHAHVPGAYEFYQDKPIVYSLGNLIFDRLIPVDGWNQGYAVCLEYDLKCKSLQGFEIIPYSQSVEQGGIWEMSGSEKEAFIALLEVYRKTVSDKELYTKAWNDFCVSQKNSILLRMFLPVKFRGLNKMAKIIPILKFLLPRSTINAKKNTVQCQSHLELLLRIIEMKCKEMFDSNVK